MTVPVGFPARYRCLEILRDDSLEFLARAEDVVLRREVLLKTPGPGMRRHLLDLRDGDRALREARALANVSHPNVVKLLDVVDNGGAPLLILEPVTGESLAERVARSGRLTPLEVARLGRALASALTALHAGGAVHRGIAPENVILGVDGAPVLVGFGFAKAASKSGGSSIHYPTSGEVANPEFSIPLPRFPAPEQILGSAADARCDVFGLGCTLEFALTGKEPETQRPHGPSRKGNSSPLSTVLERSTMRSPLQRYQTAAQFEAALRDVIASEEKVATSAPQPQVVASRGSKIAGRAALAASVIGGIALIYSFATKGPTPSESPNNEEGVRGSRVLIERDTASSAALGYEQSWALLIGISDYQDPGFADLPNAERDIDALEATLRAMPWEGWDIRRLTGKEATRENILGQLAKLAKDAEGKKRGRVLIYYAGHGDRDPVNDKAGWIVPVDGKNSRDMVDRLTCIDYREIDFRIGDLIPSHVLLMLDCCYGGVAADLGSFRSSDATMVVDIAANLSDPAKMVLTSGARHQRVSDGSVETGHSPFFVAFKEALECGERAVAVTDVYVRMRKSMTGQGSDPRLGRIAEGLGDFTFFPKPPTH